jgi:hypothetical protein
MWLSFFSQGKGQGARDTGHGAQGSEQTLSPESVVERSRNHGALNGVSRVVRHNPMFFTLTFRICTGSISSENLSRLVISFLIQSKSLFEAAKGREHFMKDFFK